MKLITAGFFFFLIINGTIAQDGIKSNKPHFFIEPEIMAGKVVPNFQHYPPTDFESSLFLSIGTLNKSPDEHWCAFYNYPSTGISFAFSRLGNEKVFGNELKVLPFIVMKTSTSPMKSWYFKLGLGFSYFTKYYNAVDNSRDFAIGSHFTWSFQTFLYHNICINKSRWLKVGIGYLHASNGHTQLPNFGLNSAMVSIAAQIFTHPDSVCMANDKNIALDHTKHYFFQLRTGIGMHEFGSTTGPVGGPKKPVYADAVCAGIIFKQHIKVKAGFGYRFYQHYYDYIVSHREPGYIEHPALSASNVFFFTGCEFLIGHIGMDMEGGINLYKPFFKRFRQIYEGGSNRDYVLKKTFLARLGLNYYLFNTNKKPKNNLYIGPTLNANFGQADFSEISVGYVHLMK